MSEAQKPQIGKIVHYFNPKTPTLIGRTAGFGGRGIGPYAAMVTNDLGVGLTLMVFMPDILPMEFAGVPHKDEVTIQDGAYWDWATPIEKARAAKAA